MEQIIGWPRAAAALVVVCLVAGGASCSNATPRGIPGSEQAGNGGTIGGLGGSAGTAGATTELPADNEPVDFFRDIQPILGEYCVRCHGGVRELGAPPLNLQSREKAAFALGKAGVPESSILYLRVALEDPELRMPLGQPALPADKVNKLRRWIYQGAPWPTQWSFVPLASIDPSTVAVSNEGWAKTPIDRFILNRLDTLGIAPAAEASKETLIRRLSLDLVGLPPTLAEVDAFVADTAPNAYEALVDRLLASPAFGERWARHWLDQARYADSNGYQKDLTRPNAWRYRDWVVDSINADQPFDQFTTEQLAGDLLADSTALQKLATGFSRNTLKNDEMGVDPEEDRVLRVLDRTATIGTAWLGLTLGCTQCHSHPYDPIDHKEFYRLYAFFNTSDEVTATVPLTGADPAGGTLQADVMSEQTANRRSTYLFTRGNFLNPDMSEPLQGAGPAILPPLIARGATPDRLDLAKWLVDAQNPLTARVAVNTIWYYLFGAGIVTTLEDFGSRATYPSHPKLLDWLASSFISSGFRRKALIKQLVLSATYRQSSAARPDVTIDAENTSLYRQNRFRVEAEIIYDLYLAVAGQLSSKRGGPPVYPPLPAQIDISYDGVTWPTSTGEDAHRRGLYTFHQRTLLYPSLAIFDRPSAAVSQTGRSRSNTPLQALTTLHDPVFVDAGRAFAQRVQTSGGSTLQERLIYAFRLALARPPSAQELTELEGVYNDSLATFQASPSEATAAVGAFQAEGVPVPEAAAWVNTARTLLNLDKFITRD
jgi:hypothetical protein